MRCGVAVEGLLLGLVLELGLWRDGCWESLRWIFSWVGVGESWGLA